MPLMFQVNVRHQQYARQVLPAPRFRVMDKMPMFRAKDLVHKLVWSDWHALTYPAVVDSGSGEPTSGVCNLVLETRKSLFPPPSLDIMPEKGPGLGC